MATLFKMSVIALALFGVAYLLFIYANAWFTKVAFVAPVVGAVSFAACGLAVLGVIMLAKLNWK